MRVLRLLRQPAPRALWLGQLLSVTGDKLYAMAVLWLVLRLTGSASLMAGVTAAESVPYVAAGLLGAGLISRARPVRALVGLDLASAAVVGVIPVTYLLGLRSVALLILAAAAASALAALFAPALQAALPGMVAAPDVPPMVALADTTDRLARMLGPGTAGLLLLVLPEIHLFTLDAASFLVSAAALSFAARRLADRPGAARPAGPAGPRCGARAGLREVGRQPALRTGLALRAACNLAWPAFTIGLPFELTGRLHAGLAGYGLMLGVFGAGNLAGNLLSGSRAAARHLVAAACLAWSLAGAGFLGLALAPSLAAAAAATGWAGIWTPLANVGVDAHIAAVVPPGRLAAVYAVQSTAVAAASAAGAFAVAAAIGALSAPAVIAAAGGWMALAGAAAAVTSSRRAPGGRRRRR